MRKAWMLVRLLTHLLYGFVVSLVFWPLFSKAMKEAIEKRWARQLLGILNVKVKVAELVEPPRHSKRSALAAADATPL